VQSLKHRFLANTLSSIRSARRASSRAASEKTQGNTRMCACRSAPYSRHPHHHHRV
jgi:hypothetical protein